MPPGIGTMNQFENEYFFLVQPRDDNKDLDVLPFLTPDDTTAKLPYQYAVLPLGSKPLVFMNGEKEANLKYGVSVIKTPPPVLFAGNHPLVNGQIREKLLRLELPNVALQPAIFVDDWDKWHEDYWYLTFLERLDCWSRTDSVYEQSDPPLELGGYEFYQVYQFSLDDQVLGKVDKERRMLFQMGGTQEGFVVAHQSVAALFGRTQGVQVLGIGDYPDKY